MSEILTARPNPDFEQYRNYIDSALEHAGGTHTVDDVRHGIDEGRLQFWPGPHSVIVTEILQYPRQRILHFFLAAGRLQELEAMLPPILEWGRSHGCTRASLVGRAGWARSFLKRQGWRATAVVMETLKL